MLSNFVTNILHVLSYATDDQERQGMDWYPSAHALAYTLTPDVWQGAGVIAAYSPQTPWWRNVELATDSLLRGSARTDTLGWNAQSAQRIISGEHPLSVFNGRKTRAFTANIANPADDFSVTVDSIAYSVAKGYHVASKNARMGKRAYNEIADAYRTAGLMAGLIPSQIQAITWIVWRDDNYNKAARKRGM